MQKYNQVQHWSVVAVDVVLKIVLISSVVAFVTIFVVIAGI